MKFDGRIPTEGANYSKENPLKELALLLGGAIVVIGGLVFAVAWTADRAVAAIPPEWEARLFGLRDAEWMGEKAEPDTELERLTGRLAAHWPENPYDLLVARLEAEEPNALALPGGIILVTSGLIEQSESENELAFVLAHELGHFRNRDHLRAIGRGLAVRLSLAAGMALIGGDGGSSVVWAEEIASRRFSQGQESDADAFALQLVEAEYGHVNGAGDFFTRLPSSESAIARQFERFLSTHPVSADRIAAIEELAAERGWRTEGSLTPLKLD